MSRPLRRLCPVGLAALILVATGAPTARAGSLRTGFTDREAFDQGAAERAQGLAHARDARASIIRVFVEWSQVAPAAPPSTAAARDPFWPGYRWAKTDAIVRDITAAGLRPLLTLYRAPRWAEGPARPPISDAAPPGTWLPSPTAYRDFAEAAARRYSGGALPRVRYWQGWNEPNLTPYYAPQWRRVGRSLRAASPTSYRRLLNGFYSGVKTAGRSNLVIAAATSPFGDPHRGGSRMPPALFTRSLLCVSGRRKPRPVRSCPGGPVRFDAMSHHPYAIGSPQSHALNPDDVVVPDLVKLTRPLRVALRAGKVRPRRPKQLWATELSWDTNPPDPDGVPVQTQARYLEGSFYVLWRQGVDVVTWFLIRDSAEGPGFGRTLQGGVFFRGASIAGDRPKPSFTAFRFPFTAYRKRRVATLWGIAPHRGRVRIEIFRGRAWRRLTVLRTRRDRIFVRSLRVRKGVVLRAGQGAEKSLSWRVR